MTDDSNATEPLEDDPEADTGDEQDDGTAGEHQQPQQPTEELVSAKRYKDLQATYTRSQQRVKDLEDRVLASQQPQARPDPTDPLAAQRAQIEAERTQLRNEREWERIRSSKPKELVDAYTEFQRSFALNPTAEGAMTAYEQSIGSFAARLAAAEAEEEMAQAPPTRSRVDTSRSEAPDPDAINERIARAKANHDPAAMVSALFGFSARRRS